MADLTTAFGALTPDKAAAFFPGVPVDDQIVQNGAVNTLRLEQWLATFDTRSCSYPDKPPRQPRPAARAPSWRTASTGHTRPQPDPANPANTVVRLPSLGDVPDGSDVIITWTKKVGDSVRANESLAVRERAKAEAEIPSPVTRDLAGDHRRRQQHRQGGRPHRHSRLRGAPA